MHRMKLANENSFVQIVDQYELRLTKDILPLDLLQRRQMLSQLKIEARDISIIIVAFWIVVDRGALVKIPLPAR